MPLINFEINLQLKWSLTCVIANSTGAGTFAITANVPVVTLSTQYNAKLLQQLKSGFKKKITGININQKYHQKPKINI